MCLSFCARNRTTKNVILLRSVRLLIFAGTCNGCAFDRMLIVMHSFFTRNVDDLILMVKYSMFCNRYSVNRTIDELDNLRWTLSILTNYKYLDYAIVCSLDARYLAFESIVSYYQSDSIEK